MLQEEPGNILLMDRGFLDGEWITHLKIDRKIDICMAFRSNSEITQFAVAQAERDNCWGHIRLLKIKKFTR